MSTDNGNISTQQGALIALGMVAAIVFGGLILTGVLPKTVWDTVYTLFLIVWWYWIVRQVWPRMPQKQHIWMSIWTYMIGFPIIFPLSALLFDGTETAYERFILKIQAVLFWALIVAFIYLIIYKNKPKMRKKIVAGNWKMNTLPAEGVELAKGVAAGRGEVCSCVNFIVCPPFTHLSMVAEALKGSDIALGAQDCATEAKGAYTGEIAASMIAALGCKYVILGHSERRQYYGETSATLNKKMAQAYANGLIPIYCVGENLDEREAGKHFDVVKAQIEEVVYNLTEEQYKSLVIAYEPVWAIGTGKTATAEQAQEIHAYIRQVLAAKFGAAAAETAILYGGSCKPSNAAELFAKEDVDGGLIGGAALKAEDFLGIGKGFAK